MPPSATPARPIAAPSVETHSTEGVARLVREIAAGNTEAFAAFYESWFDRALDLARALTRRDDHFCFDVVQDAMLRAVRSLSPSLGLAARDDLDRWTTRVVHTTALDALRRESRRRARELRSVRRSSPRASANADPSDQPAHGAHPASHDLLLLAERITWLRVQIDQLDAVERSLVVARFGSDRTLSDAARDHGVSAGSATGRLTRLLARLRLAGRELFHDD